MKRFNLLFFFLLIGILLSKGQTPGAFNYQGVLRDNSGNTVQDREISVRISLLQNDATSSAVYSEIHTVKTNAYGVFTLQVGDGFTEIGSFSEIEWASNNYFLQVEIDMNAGSNYEFLGVSQILSVPYSMFSNQSENSNNAQEAAHALVADNSKLSDTAFVAKKLDEDVLYFTNTDTLFAVKDREGNIVFAVFPDGAKVYVNDGVKGRVGGFAVTGRNPTKADYLEEEYLRVTPDSTRIWVNESSTKARVGGFAVTGRNPTKGMADDYLVVTSDSTRVYVTESDTKARVGGFAVTGRNPTKGESSKFMNITRDNYFIGHQSGQILSNGLYNSILGYQSGLSITDGESNSFMGYQSGYKTNTGDGNIFIGYQTGYSNQTGNYNTFMGYKTGFSNSSGLFNTFLGSYSGYSNQTGNNNTFVGDSTGYKNTGSSNTFYGTKTGLNNSSGYENVFIGNMCGYGNTTGFSNVYIGNKSGYSKNASNNVLIGHEAGYSSSGGSNVVIGARAAKNAGSANSNVIIGRESGLNITSGYSNVFIGEFSGMENASGFYNVYMGKGSGQYASGAGWNVSIGTNSGMYNTGLSSVFIGTECGKVNTGAGNVMIGGKAGMNNVNGYRNVFIGLSAGENETGSRKLYIENSNADSSMALIYGDFDTDWVRINDALGVGRNPETNHFEVEGSASKTTAGDWAANSDRRIKTDIQDIENSFETILKLHPVKFKYTDYWMSEHPSIQDQYYYNFIAQEYQQVFPESVKGSGEYIKGDSNEILQIDTYNAQVVTIKAVQDLILENKEQQQIIENQKIVLQTIKSEVKDLKSENDELKQKLNEIIELLKEE